MSLREVLAAQYGLQLREARHIDYGMWEEAFHIDTDHGRYFAKRFMRRDRQTETMLKGLELGERLRRQGFPAPRVLPTLSGSLLAHCADERYQVTEWINGRTYRPGELPLREAASMGALLGRFHRMAAPLRMESPSPEIPQPPPVPSQPRPLATGYPSPADAQARCQKLLERFAHHPEPFAAVAREVLKAQIATLSSLPAELHLHLPLPKLGGPLFNSYWVEQLLFYPDGQVAALVDWTDGAGKPGHWVSDLALGIHLSALDLNHAVAFTAAYQALNPLPSEEWRALAAGLCYGHLASTNFLGGWFARPYRRMAAWEETARVWHEQIVPRFRAWSHWDEALATHAV